MAVAVKGLAKGAQLRVSSHNWNVL